MRIGTPKYSGVWSLLAALGFLGIILQKHVNLADRQWVGNLGGLCLTGAMVIMVAGMIAERKSEEKEKAPEQPR
jgi:hypothetical protein